MQKKKKILFDSYIWIFVSNMEASGEVAIQRVYIRTSKSIIDGATNFELKAKDKLSWTYASRWVGKQFRSFSGPRTSTLRIEIDESFESHIPSTR